MCFLAGARDYFIFECVSTISEAHPVSCFIGAVNCFKRVKRPGSEADHLPPYSAEVKNEWSYNSITHVPS